MKQELYLLSGLLCDHTVWGPLTEILSDRYTIRAIDFRGFDKLRDMADYVLDTVTDGAAIAGHSMGARVALEVYKSAPGRVGSLALFNTGTHPAKPGEQASRQRLIDLSREEGMGALADQWLPPMLLPANRENADIYDPLREMVLRMTPEIYEQQARALLSRPDAGDYLEDIRCPVLIGVGREDQWSPIAQHEFIAERVRNSTLVIFDNAGHMAPYEVPSQVAEAVTAWLK